MFIYEIILTSWLHQGEQFVHLAFTAQNSVQKFSLTVDSGS